MASSTGKRLATFGLGAISGSLLTQVSYLQNFFSPRIWDKYAWLFVPDKPLQLSVMFAMHTSGVELHKVEKTYQGQTFYLIQHICQLQRYTITTLHQLLIYTSKKHSRLSTWTFGACASLFRHPVWLLNKRIYASLLIKMLSITNPSLACCK